MAIVSVGIPVFNGEKYLAETLDALLAQSLKDFEIVLSDNASTDRTAAICRSYQEKDHRVRYFRNDNNIGAARNFNRTVELFDSLSSTAGPATISIILCAWSVASIPSAKIRGWCSAMPAQG